MRNFISYSVIVILALAQVVMFDNYFPQFRLIGDSYLQLTAWFVVLGLILTMIQLIIGMLLYGSGLRSSNNLFREPDAVAPFIIQIQIYFLTCMLLIVGIGTEWLQILVAFILALLIPTFTTRYILFER